MRYFTLALCALSVCLASLGSAAGGAQTPPSADPEVLLPANVVEEAAKDAKLASVLARLEGHAAQSGARGLTAQLPEDVQSAIDAGTVRIDVYDRVQVYVDVTGDADDAAADLVAIGMEVEQIAEDLSIVQGRLPVEALDAAADLASVSGVRPPEYALRNVTTEGDAILDADDLRASYAVNGAGVRVGVISDGLEGLAAAQGAGELPAVNFTTCDATGAAPAGEPANPTDAGAGAEGTAMLEIVHDIAPGAELWFGYFGFNVSSGTSLDFRQAVDCLALNTDVVVDDITYVNNGAYDGTSVVSQNTSTELNRLTNRIRGHYNSVGSVSQQHYQEPFVDSGFNVTVGMNTWDIHRFQATASTTDGAQGRNCSFNAADGFCADRVMLPPNEVLRVGLQWDDPFGASANDYELFLLDENASTLYLISTNEQNGNDNPVEEFSWLNDTAVVQPLSIYIGRFAGVSKTFDMFVLCEACNPIAGNKHNFNTISSAVLNNADAGGGVVSLGAINASDPGNNDIAAYSSRGPTNDGRVKPDAVAIDGVSVSGAGGFSSPFFGSSAAAPHAAGIAALVLACQPSLKHGGPGDAPAADRTALRNALLNSAVDLGSAGTDNTYGAGRLDADAAAAAAGCAPDSDGDGVPQIADNCPGAANAGQENSDRNFIDLSPPKAYDDITVARSDEAGDACDADDDNDARTDTDETGGVGCGGAVTNPLDSDSDGDNYLDGAECAIGTNPNDVSSRPTQAQCGTTTDVDGDKLLAFREVCFYNTDPAIANSDGDACGDAREVGSINGDLVVNVVDLQQIATAQGAYVRPGTPVQVNFDITRDGNINVADLQQAASYQGNCP